MKTEQYKIELSSEAESDFDNSYNYYAIESQIVADSFFKEVNKSLNTISDNPNGFQKTFGKIRRYVMRKFPFVIYYRIKDDVIQVIAIFHSSRNPKIMKDRYKTI